MPRSIQNRIAKTGTVDWRKLKPFQPDILKRQSVEQFDKLKRSLKMNGFASPFYVYQKKNVIYILDGHHRLPAMRELELEGLKIPDELPAVWVKVKDDKEAKKLLLVFNSHYAKIQKDGLGDFIEGLDMDSLLFEIDIPELQLDNLETAEPDYGELDERVTSTNHLKGALTESQLKLLDIEIERRAAFTKQSNEVAERTWAIDRCILTLQRESDSNIRSNS